MFTLLHLIWTGGFLAAFALITAITLQTWMRRFVREERQAISLADARDAATQAAYLEDLAAAERYRAIAESWAVVLWRTDHEGNVLSAEGWTALTGEPEEKALAGAWVNRIHPEDRAEVLASLRGSIAAGLPMDFEYQLQTKAGEWRWYRARGVPLPLGGSEPPREWVGVLEDIHHRRRAEEHRLLAVREIDHRAKNVLAAVQSIVRLSKAATIAAYSSAVVARISSLSRAHELLAEGGWAGTDLRSIVSKELASYQGESQTPPIVICGDELPVTATAVQPLSMVLHELATNAAKHGSLSMPTGTVTLVWSVTETALHMSWTEAGGPPIEAAPTDRGFGSRLIEATIKGQLGGSLTRHWPPSGLVCQIEIPLTSLTPKPNSIPIAA